MHYDYSPGLGAMSHYDHMGDVAALEAAKAAKGVTSSRSTPATAMPSPEAAAFSLFIPQMQEGLTKKYTSYQIYNLIRFNDPDIGGPKAGVSGFPRLTQRMKANTPPFGYEIGFFGVREAFKKRFMPKKFKNSDLNSKLYKDFKAALGVVRLLPLPGGALPPPGAGADTNDNENIDEGANTQGANTQGTTPSAFPIVPVAIAAAGLAAILLMRKK